jgi:ubiquinone/menaquinone biosynthesis C-methylase UbiE
MHDAPSRESIADLPLADGLSRDYSHKLDLFNHFAEAELRSAIAAVQVRPGSRIVDAGCGTGLQSAWLAEAAAPGGTLLAVDISAAHAALAKSRLERAPIPATAIVADVGRLQLRPRTVDLIWCSNTLNHLGRPEEVLAGWRRALKPGGRVVVAQSSFLPEMMFAWDARLESAVNDACLRYYRDKYALSAEATTNARNVVGFMRRAGFSSVTPRTIVIERTAPLGSSDTAYLVEAVFNGYWRRVHSYLSERDAETLRRLADPASPDFALARPDFHFLMTYTLVVGTAEPADVTAPA